MEGFLISVVLLSMCSFGFTQGCRMALQNNMDFPGSDVARVYASDAKHCQQLCTDHPSCMFFTFVRPDWTRDNRHFYCYFKVTASGEPKIQTPIFGATSGYSLRSCTPKLTEFPVYQNVDFLGADYKTLFTTNYGDCQRVCTDDPFCQFFTFVNGEFTPASIRFKCHLKYSWTVPRPPVIAALANVVSGFSRSIQMLQPKFAEECERSLFPQVDIAGKNFEEVAAVSDKHCQVLCSAHPRCTYFSFTSESFRCHLKENPLEMVLKAQNGVTSGIPARGCQLDDTWVRTPVEGVDFRGEDIQNRMVDSAEACQKACDEDDKCQFYTYLTEQFINRDYRRRCFLKRTITIPAPPKIVKLQNVVSGFSLTAVP
uniref:Coagulation factor XI-like n=1 Tax=Takifugu rubripes TaxID=31033 RepID=A0A674P8I9_TAKRU